MSGLGENALRPDSLVGEAIAFGRSKCRLSKRELAKTFWRLFRWFGPCAMPYQEAMSLLLLERDPGSDDEVAFASSWRDFTKAMERVERHFGERAASTLGWTQNRFIIKTVMFFRGPIYNAVAPLTGSYAKEVALIIAAGYKYFYDVWPY